MNEHEMRIRELEIALEANRVLLVMETEKARQALLQFTAIGHELCGAAFDEFLAGRKVENLSPEELAGRIIGIVKVSLALQNQDGGELVVLRRDVEEKGRQVDTLTRRASRADDVIRQLRVQVGILEEDRGKLRREVEKLTAAVRSLEESAPDADLERWFAVWKNGRNFERDSRVIRVIGETGWAQGERICGSHSEQSGTSKRTPSRALISLLDAGLVDRQKGFSEGGNSPFLYWLTEKGRWVYTRLTNQPPVASEYDGMLKAHKSKRQSGLILKAAELFRRFGYKPQTQVTHIQLEGGRHFDPDFIVEKDGEIYYIEFETGVGVDRPSLAQKWENASAVGGGRICIVGRNKATMQNLINNVVGWAGDSGKKVHIYATHMEALKTLEIASGPWVVEKER